MLAVLRMQGHDMYMYSKAHPATHPSISGTMQPTYSLPVQMYNRIAHFVTVLTIYNIGLYNAYIRWSV